MINQLISKNKFNLVVGFVLILTSFWVRYPDYWWGQWALQNGLWFSGQASWVDHIDLNVYFRVIRMAMEGGGFRIVNVADSVGDEVAVLYPVYTMIGKAGSLFSSDPATLFHFFGTVTGVALMLVVWWFLGIFLKKPSLRFVGWSWSFFASGLGWLSFPEMVYPDLGVPIFTLWSALRAPHEAVSVMGLLLVLGCSFLYLKQNIVRIRWLVGAVVGSLAVLIHHPQMMMPVGIIVFLWSMGLWLKSKVVFSRLVILGGTLGGSFLLFFWLAGSDLLFSAVTQGLRVQGTYVFSWWYWLIGWGLVGWIALSWLIKRLKKDSRHFEKLAVVVWVSIQLLLFYIPGIPYQGMMIRGVWIGVVVMAVWGMEDFVKRKHWNLLLVGLTVLLLSLGNVFFIYQQRMNGMHQPRSIYVKAEEGIIWRYLKANSAFDQGIIGSYRTANLALTHSRARPYAGHYPLTPDFNERYEEVLAFYRQDMADDEAYGWVKQKGIDWVFWGPDEWELRGSREPAYSWLDPVVEAGAVRLYRIY